MELLERLVEAVGHEDQVRTWLEHYRPDDSLFPTSKSSPFAIAKASGSCSQRDIESLADDVSLLSGLGLYLPVITGFGEVATRHLEDIGHVSAWVDGDRVTPRKQIGTIQEIAFGQAMRFYDAFYDRNVKASLCFDVFEATHKVLEGYDDHRNGEITHVNEAPVRAMLRHRMIPIISPLGHDDDGYFNMNATTCMVELVRKLHDTGEGPARAILLTRSGGILNGSDVLSELSLKKDYDALVENGVLYGGAKKNVDDAYRLLDEGHLEAVQISSPQNLLAELFTDKGAGTYITRE